VLGEVICQVLCARSPVIVELSLGVAHRSQWNRMSMALSALGNILLLSSACAVELSVCIGVRGCGWPSLMRVCRMEMAAFALICPLSTANAAAAPKPPLPPPPPSLALLSCRSLVLSLSYHCAAHSLSHCAGWLLRCLLSHRPLVVLSPRRPLVILLWLVVALPPVTPLSRPLVVPCTCPFVPTLMPTPAAHRTLPV
jgi:hypothetical protein